MFCEPRKLGLAALLAIALSLLLAQTEADFAPLPPPPEPEPRPETDWRIEVAHEGLIQALANLTGMGLDEAGEVVRIAEREARKYDDVDPLRVLALIVAESQGNPRAVSRAGARGLMQIMPGTGRYIASARKERWGGIKSLYEVETNISYGVWYYHHLLEVFSGDEQAAVAAYNWGPGHITWRLGKGRRLPVVYPGKVIEAQRELEREFSNEASRNFWQRLRGNGSATGLEPHTR